MRTFGSVASLLVATLYQENPSFGISYQLRDIYSIVQVLLDCCYKAGIIIILSI